MGLKLRFPDYCQAVAFKTHFKMCPWSNNHGPVVQLYCSHLTKQERVNDTDIVHRSITVLTVYFLQNTHESRQGKMWPLHAITAVCDTAWLSIALYGVSWMHTLTVQTVTVDQHRNIQKM